MASMRTLRPAGHLANRAAGRWVFDALIALLAWASAVLFYNANTHHPPGAAKTVVLALMVAPLVVRRIWPIQVFGVIVAATIGVVLWDKHLLAWLAVLIALFTVAELRSRRAALVCGYAVVLIAAAAWRLRRSDA